MGDYPDDESGCRKKPRSSETNATSEMHHLPVPTLDARQACHRFSRGQCAMGELCRYSHVIRETEGERGHLAVSLRRTERVNFCQFFLGAQPCPHGSKCRFLHETSGDQGDSGMCSEFRESSAICITTNNDKRLTIPTSNDPQVRPSSNDPQVQANPVWFKTKLCIMWEKMGSCCTYAHGNAELRTVEYPNPLNSSRGHDLDTTSKNTESRTVQHGKQFLFKWTDVKKISRVYGDWIDDDPSGKDGN